MKRSLLGLLFGAALVALSLVPAVSQSPQGGDAAPPAKAAKAKKSGPPDTSNWPWIKLHPATPPYQPNEAELRQIHEKLDQLDGMIRELKSKNPNNELLPDVEIYAEAGHWKLAYPIEFFTAKSVGATLKVLDTGIERAGQLKEGKSPWTTQKGRVDRGYRSAVDGSIQPIRITVPDEYDGVHPVPLDVAQHGRFTNLYEVETLSSNSGMEIQYLPGTLQIDLFGRGRNTYHWLGEADTFEAMEFAKRAYKIDPERMTLRGFSMGGAGVWHTSLHHPDLWAAVEVGAGNNTSHRIPVLNTLPPTYQAMTTLFDNMYQWAINAYDIPFVSYVGENDGNRTTHESARQELIKEGINFEGEPFTLKATNAPFMMFVIGPNTGHAMNKDSRKLINGWLYDRLKLGRQVPDHIRFTTYTTRYNRDYWVTVDGMAKQYDRAEIDAKRSDNRADYDITTTNINRLVLTQTDHATAINIDGEKLKVKPEPELALEKNNGTWKVAGLKEKGLHKRHGMQGPIDDAFLEPFLVVRPTGTPWNAAVNDQSLRMLERFARQYPMIYRAHIRVKDDKDVTADDFAKYNVVLFGDPGSNRWIAKLNGKLPLHWTKETVSLGSKSFPAAETVPALIYPDPMHASHYVVINSGLTPDWKDWAGDFPTPRYGDFAMFQVKAGEDDPQALYAGMFDESWKVQ